MPLILQAIRIVSKGKAAAETYFALWCHSMSHSIVELVDVAGLIAAAGYSGDRTWKDRLKKLEQLGFIRTARGTNCVLIMNPHKVLKRLKESGKHPELERGLYNRIMKEMVDYGCLDFVGKVRLSVLPSPSFAATQGKR